MRGAPGPRRADKSALIPVYMKCPAVSMIVSVCSCLTRCRTVNPPQVRNQPGGTARRTRALPLESTYLLVVLGLRQVSRFHKSGHTTLYMGPRSVTWFTKPPYYAPRRADVSCDAVPASLARTRNCSLSCVLAETMSLIMMT